MPMSQEDRDRFIRMDTTLENLKEYLKDTLPTHIKDDKDAFEKHGDQIGWLQKMVYLGMGGLFMLNLVLKFLFK